MAPRKEFELYVLRYVPNTVKGEFVNIGLMMWEADPAGFADVHFVPDWKAAERLDPEIDIEMLQAMERYVRTQLRDSAGRTLLLRKMEDSFSNVIQLSPRIVLLAEDPAKELEALASFYFRTVHPVSQRAPSARGRIWQQMQSAFEQQGILGALLVDTPMAKYTEPGDPLKLDFGYYAEPNLKFFQAVSLKTNSTQGTNLASRFPRLAKAIMRETRATPLLTAVVDDDLDRNSQEVAFALNFMTQHQIQVVIAAEMPKIAERARLELRL